MEVAAIQEEFVCPQYLNSPIVRLRAFVPERYALLHLGSGTLIATDRLGDAAASRLQVGADTRAVACWLEARAAGAGERFGLLLAALGAVGALTAAPPPRNVRWWARLVAARLLGFAASLGGLCVPYLPLGVQIWLFDWLPQAVLGPRMLAHSGWYVDQVLAASGYAGRTHLVRRICEASTRTFLLIFLAALQPPARAHALVDRLLVAQGAEEMARATGERGAVVACLHSDGFLALLLRHGLRRDNAACLVQPWMANTTLGTSQRGGGWIEAYLGRLVPAAHASAGRALAQHVRGGGIAIVPFDASPLSAERAATITFLGRVIRANAGPAWLAIRADCPIFLASTRFDGRRIVLRYSRVAAEQDDRPAAARIAALTQRLYQQAESVIRDDPGAWLGWTFLEQFVAPDVVGASLAAAERVAAEDVASRTMPSPSIAGAQLAEGMVSA